jgi:NADH dehydrogenase FAD-containing subunit
VVLRPFDKALQHAAIEALTAPPKDDKLLRYDLTQLIDDKPVEKVTEDAIYLKDGTEIPYGPAVWAGGIGPLPITLKIIEALGGMQERAQRVARGKIGVDPWLRVVEGKGRIFALGDCTCTQGSVSSIDF